MREGEIHEDDSLYAMSAVTNTDENIDLIHHTLTESRQLTINQIVNAINIFVEEFGIFFV